MNDLNQKLSRLREQRAEASEKIQRMVGEAEGPLSAEQREKMAEWEAQVRDATTQIDDLERALQVGAHHRNINEPLGLSDQEKRRYSFMKLVRALAFRQENPKLLNEVGLELECSRAIAGNIEREPSGVYIPRELWSQDAERRTMITATGDLGGYLVADDLRDDLFIGMLRNTSALAGLGAMQLPGLRGDVSIPKQVGAGQLYWLGTEETDVTESTQAVAQVRLRPKHAAAHTRFSRQALIQTSPAVEALIRNDLAVIAGLGIDLAALYGSGVNGEPQGLRNTTGVNKPTAFAGATPTWAEVLALVAAVAADNALIGFGGGEDGGMPTGVTGFLTEGAMAANLMGQTKDTGSGQFVLQMEGGAPRIGLWPLAVSNQITTGDLWFGSWGNLVMGSWGDPDLIVNPFTNDTSGVVRLTLHQFVDVAVRHPEAFGWNT